MRPTWRHIGLRGAAWICVVLAGCRAEPSAHQAQQEPDPDKELAAAVDQRPAPDLGPDPRIRQREQLAAAESLLQRDGSHLAMTQYRALESRLLGLLDSGDTKGSVHLALAILYEFHAPDEAFPAPPDDPGRALLDDGRSRSRVLAAIASLHKAVDSDPTNIAALWQLALLKENVDDKAAVDLWRQLLQHAPEHLQALSRLGEGLLLLEDYEAALKTGEQALKLAEARADEEEQGRARNVLGRAYLQQGKYQQAEEMLKNAAVRTDGSHWGCAYQSLGQLYATLGESDLQGMGAPADRATVDKAIDAYQRDDYAQALQQLDTAISSKPRDEFQVLRGFLLFFQEDDAGAEILFRRIKKSSPDDPGPATGLAHLAIVRGDYKQASELLQPALQTWHQTRLSSKDLPRYYAFLHRLACLANGRIQLQRQQQDHAESARNKDAELARAVCAMDLGFGAGPDASAPAWTEARPPGRASP